MQMNGQSSAVGRYGFAGGRTKAFHSRFFGSRFVLHRETAEKRAEYVEDPEACMWSRFNSELTSRLPPRAPTSIDLGPWPQFCACSSC